MADPALSLLSLRDIAGKLAYEVGERSDERHPEQECEARERENADGGDYRHRVTALHPCPSLQQDDQGIQDEGEERRDHEEQDGLAQLDHDHDEGDRHEDHRVDGQNGAKRNALGLRAVEQALPARLRRFRLHNPSMAGPGVAVVPAWRGDGRGPSSRRATSAD